MPPAASGKLPVIFPDGEAGTILSKDWPRAQALGVTINKDWKSVRDKEAGKFLESTTAKVVAGGKALGRGLTFGLTDVLDVATGGDPGLSQELKEKHPGISAAGEIAGFVGTAALGPAVGLGKAAAAGAGKLLARKGVETLGRTVARGAVQTAGAGAAEGAAYSAGQMVTEGAIGDSDLTAGKVMGHVISGGVMGAAAGGVLGAAAPLAKTATAKGREIIAGSSDFFVKKAMGLPGTQKAATGQAIKALGSTPAKIKKLISNETLKAPDGSVLRTRADDVGEALLEERSVLGGKRILDGLGSLDKTAANVKKVMRHAGREKTKIINRLSPEAEKIGEGVNPVTIARRIREELMGDVADEAGALPVMKADAKLVQRIVDEWVDSAGERGILTLKKADAWKTKYQKMASKAYDRANKGGESFKDDAIITTARVVRQEVDRVVERAAKAVGDEDAYKAYLKHKKTYSALADADELVENGIGRQAGNRFFSLTDYGTSGSSAAVGAFLGGPAGAVAGGVLGAAGNQLIRKRGSAIAASLMAPKAAKLAAVKAAAKSSDSRIGAVIKQLAKAKDDTLRKIAAPLSGDVFDSLSFAAGPAYSKEKDAPAYKRRIRELSEAASNPEKMHEVVAKMTGDLAEMAPGLAVAAGQKVEASIRHLDKTAPKPQIHQDVAFPIADNEDWEPSAGEMSAWANRVQAVKDPIGVFEGVSDGSIMPEAVDTLRILFPEVHAETMEKLAMQADSIQKGMTQTQRNALSIYMGVPSTPFVRNGLTQSLQTSYLGEEAPPQAQDISSPSAVKPTATGLKKLDMSKREQTSSERLLSR